MGIDENGLGTSPASRESASGKNLASRRRQGALHHAVDVTRAADDRAAVSPHPCLEVDRKKLNGLPARQFIDLHVRDPFS